MDRTTRCLHCGKRLVPAPVNGRTELQCMWCDKLDPLQTDALKWAQGPLADTRPELFSKPELSNNEQAAGIPYRRHLRLPQALE